MRIPSGVVAAMGGDGPGINLGLAFFAPLTDAGAGVVNTTPARGAGAASFTRATNATTWGSTGLLLTVGNNVPRFTYTELTGAVALGYLSEEARTNNCIQNRDFTNVAWVMTTMTAAKDQVGIDGTANAASSLLATAGNATAKQTVTIAAVNRPFSVYVKRLVGTGNIGLAQDGATFTDIAVANDGAWHRIFLLANQLNPILSVRLATNTDKIAVDYAALEDSGGGSTINGAPGTPIATVAAAVTRNGDQLSYPTAGNFSSAVGSAYAEISVPNGSTGFTAILGSYNGTGSLVLEYPNASNLGFYDGTGHRIGPALARTLVAVTRCSSAWGGVTGSAAVNGTVVSALTFDGSMDTALGVFVVGAVLTTNQFINGTVKNVKLWNRTLSDAELASL